jgi:uncharacterized membrane protein
MATRATASKLPTEAIGSIASQLPTDKLKAELLDYLKALGSAAVSSAAGQVGRLSSKLPGKAGGVAGSVAGSVAKKVTEAGVTGVKEKVKETLGGGGNGGGSGTGGGKVTNIVEGIDVGVPVGVAYNQWTRFTDYPDFMKRVEDVEQESETESRWRAKIFLSHREWKATVTEQIPDERIVWRSEGAKGRVDGAVSFHALTPDLTRIMVVLQYYPQGFFEKVGNLWRAQGRRARLELKHFQRHVMTEVALHPDEVEGWRGEVHDGEVTSSPDEPEAEAEQPPQQREPERREPRKRQAAQRQPARSGAGGRSRRR